MEDILLSASSKYSDIVSEKSNLPDSNNKGEWAVLMIVAQKILSQDIKQ